MPPTWLVYVGAGAILALALHLADLLATEIAAFRAYRRYIRPILTDTGAIADWIRTA